MRRMMMTILFVSAFAGLAMGESAYDLNDAGIDAYANGEYGIALEKFGAAKEAAEDKPELDYNMGVTWAKDGELKKAGEAFDKAGLARDVKLRARAMQAKSSMHYDAAWSNYQEAEETGSPSKHDAAVEHAESAIKAAREALLADPTDESARINYELATRLQEKLKEQEEDDQEDEQPQDDEEKEEEEKEEETKQDKPKWNFPGMNKPNPQETKPEEKQADENQETEKQKSEMKNAQQQPSEMSEGEGNEQARADVADQPDDENGKLDLQASQEGEDGEEVNAKLNLLDTIEDNDEEALRLMLRRRRTTMPTPEKDW